MPEKRGARSRWAGALPCAAIVAVCVLPARHADGAGMLPCPIEAMLLLPVFALWAKERFGRTAGGPGNVERLLAVVVPVAGVAIGIVLRDALAPIRAAAMLAIGCMAIDRLGRLFAELESRVEQPRRLIRRMALPWLGITLAAAVLLALPIATRSAIPDYRHNFWLHAVNSLHAAAGAASLTGSTVYSFGEDYTPFGQVVIVIVMQLCGIGTAVAGLAIARPFLRRMPRVRTVLLLYLGLQAAAVLLMYGAWRSSDASSVVERLWWGVVHATSAGWNGGLTMDAKGLANYLGSSGVFACVTVLATIGSLGLPIILDVLLASRPNGAAEANASQRGRGVMSPSSPVPPWRYLPATELIAMFLIVVGTTTLIFFWETPWRPEIVWRLPEQWAPARPVDLGEGRASLRDQMPLPQRWTMSVFTACTLRSAGLQSFPTSEGAISWPTYGLFLLSMGVGGSLSGVAGGMRLSTLLLFQICLFSRRRSWAAVPDGMRLKWRLLGSLALFALGWLAFNALVVFVLAAMTQGSTYELVFDGVAAANNAGFSTGFSVHLTQAGRLAMIAAMLLGRVLPLIFWAATADRLLRATHGGAARIACQDNTQRT